MLAPDGRSKAFSAGANGYGRGEGCGAVVLKRLEDATDDGDRVLAVIKVRRFMFVVAAITVRAVFCCCCCAT